MRGFVVAGWLVIGTLGTCLPVSAQGSVDVSAGYLNVAGGMHGVNAQLTKAIDRHWAAVVEANWSSGYDCSGCQPGYRDLAVLGGIRYGWSPTPRVQPFWQFQAGGLRSTYDAYRVEPLFAGTGYIEKGGTVGYLALQPGGGVTIMATRRVGFRAQADAQLAIPNEGEGFSLFPRVTVGAVIRLGR